MAGEADAWFSRNKSAIEKNDSDEAIAMLTHWLTPFSDQIDEIIEIGCGSGHRLSYLCELLSSKGVGIDPSEKAIEYANEKHGNRCSFWTGTSTDLGVGERQFDLVHLGFFLYLVDREIYLKSLAQADTALKVGGFLSIIDFDPANRSRNRYHHAEGVTAYKIDNSQVFLNSGLYTLVNKYSFSHSDFYFNKDQDERVMLSLLYKDPDMFPERERN